MHLSSDLYPTPQIRAALEELYASVLNFLVKAYEWYNEGKLSHMFHGVSQQWNRVNADLVDEIAEKSRRIDQLAVAASQAEIRDMHQAVTAIRCRLSLSEIKLNEILGKMDCKSILRYKKDLKAPKQGHNNAHSR